LLDNCVRPSCRFPLDNSLSLRSVSFSCCLSDSPLRTPLRPHQYLLFFSSTGSLAAFSFHFTPLFSGRVDAPEIESRLFLIYAASPDGPRQKLFFRIPFLPQLPFLSLQQFLSLLRTANHIEFLLGFPIFLLFSFFVIPFRIVPAPPPATSPFSSPRQSGDVAVVDSRAVYAFFLPTFRVLVLKNVLWSLWEVPASFFPCVAHRIFSIEASAVFPLFFV